MEKQWDELFGEEFFISATNEERKYLGLNPITDNWDITQFFSKTNLWYSRTTVFLDGEIIKKIIVEEKKLLQDNAKPVFHSIQESDTNLQTENREYILPLTKKGKPKKISASTINAINPFGCSFYFSLELGQKVSTHMAIYNRRNNLSIAIGEKERTEKIQNDTDFHEFMKYYMASCPTDYFPRIERLRKSKHKTVMYHTGDLFRIEIDRFHYSYGLITGQVNNIRKWKELPENHSLRELMMVPIMVRYYELVTTDSGLSADELSAYPLSRVDICGDNEIIWGTHTIVDHKDLVLQDIEFNLVCNKIQELNPHATVYTYDMLASDGIITSPPTHMLYVEWGTATTFFPYENLSQRMLNYMKEYRSPHGGVSMTISPDNIAQETFNFKNNLLNKENSEIKSELFRCLGLPIDAGFDDFAEKFGGLSKKKILLKEL
jgi:hypothetical protein